eukprot:2127822-Heterocapsa_arctica.AAC.1
MAIVTLYPHTPVPLYSKQRRLLTSDTPGDGTGLRLSQHGYVPTRTRGPNKVKPILRADTSVQDVLRDFGARGPPTRG